MQISRFQFITNTYIAIPQHVQVQKAYEAGIDWVQVRMKDMPAETMAKEIDLCMQIANAHQVQLILNDYVSLAKDYDLDGVHLGQKDTTIAEARNTLGEDKIIGGTANTLAEVQALLDEAKVDYIGVGPLRFTNTKKVLSPILGLEGYASLLKEIINPQNIPIIAVGGIEVKDIEPLFDVGVYGIAFSNLFLNHPNPQQLIHQLTSIQNSYV
jgi:thiamine-phosphate pyrophosphorylase